MKGRNRLVGASLDQPGDNADLHIYRHSGRDLCAWRGPLYYCIAVGLTVSGLSVGCKEIGGSKGTEPDQHKIAAGPMQVASFGGDRSRTSEFEASSIIIDDLEIAKIRPEFRRYASIAQDNLREALDLILREVPRHRQDEARGMLLALFGVRSLETIHFLASTIESEEVRINILREISTEWGTRDARKFFDFALQFLAGRERNICLSQVIQTVAQNNDFRSAEVMLNAMPVSTERASALEQLANTYGRADVDKALSWSATLPNSGERSRALRLLAPYIARKDNGFDELARILPAISERSTRDAFVIEAARLLRIEDQSVALRWLAQLPVKEQEIALITLVRELPIDKIDPIVERGFQMSDPTFRRQSVSAVTERIAKHDFDSASSWVLSVPEDVRQAGFVSLVRTYNEIDAHKLAAWVTSLPGGEDRDNLVRYMALEISQTDKKSALAWADAIEDEAIRRSIKEQIGDR
jgi:hypothetical protein